MSLLKTKIKKDLKGEYVTKIKSYEEIENTQGGYIQVVLELPDRDYNYIIFPSSIDYVARSLKQQFGLDTQEEYDFDVLLDMAKEREFTVWFEYNETYNRMNVDFKKRNVVTEEAPDL